MISSKDATVHALALRSHLGIENSSLFVGHGNSTISGGLTVIQAEVINHGTLDLTNSDMTVINTDGSRAETVSMSGTGGPLISKTITTTSRRKPAIDV